MGEREAALLLLSVPRFASNMSSRVCVSPVLQGVRLLRLWATRVMQEWGRRASKQRKPHYYFPHVALDVVILGIASRGQCQSVETASWD